MTADDEKFVWQNSNEVHDEIKMLFTVQVKSGQKVSRPAIVQSRKVRIAYIVRRGVCVVVYYMSLYLRFCFGH
jgi:hypothetical protein